jgi:glycopeptide antibiotics resistance protein
MIKRFFTIRNLLIAYISTIILLMALPLNSASELNNITILQFRGDYFLHSILFLPWAFFGFLLHKKMWFWGTLGLLFAVLAEGIQYFLPYRAFNVNDVLANVIGVLIGMAVWLALRKRITTVR